jgi:hypothetical protein
VLGAAEATLSLRRGERATARRQLEGLLRIGYDDGWRYALRHWEAAPRIRVTADLLQQLVDSKAIPNVLQAWRLSAASRRSSTSSLGGTHRR